VTGLVRYANGEKATAEQVAAYRRIRREVRATRPDAQFDVELNALEYRTPDEVRSMMRRLRAKFDNDGWFFDFFTPAWDKRPDVVRAAIDEAESNGQWIGGNAFGWSKNPQVPPGADFLAVADSNFKLELSAVRALADRVPVLFHFRNNPGNRHSEGCVYMKRYTTAEREAYVRRRAKQQADGHFHFAYPVFFPTCELGRGDVAFDSLRDGTMLHTIAQLMQQYN
jgi:hypothetical protein